MRGQIENLSATSLSFTQCLAGDRLNKGPDQNLICPLKSRFHLITLCRRNYSSGLASHVHLAIAEKQIIFVILICVVLYRRKTFKWKVPIVW